MVADSKSDSCAFPTVFWNYSVTKSLKWSTPMESEAQVTMSIPVFHAYHARNQLLNLDTSRSAGSDQLHTQSGW